MKVVGKTLAVAVMLTAGAIAMAADAPATAPAMGDKNEQGLAAYITADKDTYKLDPAQSGKDFKDKLDQITKARGRGAGQLPQPPAVDVTLHVVNTTDKDVTITVGGDDSRIELKLAGQGAATVDHNAPMTMEFRIGKPVTILPGKSYDVKVNSLSFGMRGVSQYAYWTEAGDYTLTATLVYPVGEKQINVTSSPVKLKVEK